MSDADDETDEKDAVSHPDHPLTDDARSWTSDEDEVCYLHPYSDVTVDDENETYALIHDDADGDEDAGDDEHHDCYDCYSSNDDD